MVYAKPTKVIRSRINILKIKLASMPWVIGALLVSGLVCCPLFFLLLEVRKPTTNGWKQLTEKEAVETLDPEILKLLPPELQEEYLPKEPTAWQRFVDAISYEGFHATILYERLFTTLLVLTSVAVLCLFIGTFLAWLVSMWKFPGRRLLTFLLALPITIPTYIMATAYKRLTTDIQLETSIQVREQHGAEAMQHFDSYWNLCLAIFILTASFYPYVFIAARSAFCTLSADYIESSRSLGKSSFYTFRKIILPLARPAIAGGLMLVCLETLNEFGAMKILGIETLLTEIFRLRSGANDQNTPIRVSACIMTIVFILIIAEQLLRGRKKFHASRSGSVEQKAKPAHTLGVASIFFICISVFAFSFAIPFSKLVRLAWYGLEKASITDFTSPIVDSIMLAGQTSIVIITLSLFLSYAHRKVPSVSILALNKISSLGYAIPGAILGVALITWTGNLLQSNISSSLIETIFYQSTYGLVIAYSIRFLIVGLNPIEAGLRNIRSNLDEASQQMGKNPYITFFKIHLPMLKASMLAAFLVLFIDVLKELPLTLILSPFNTETLAMQTYSLFAVQEEFNLGAIPALILICTGIIGMLIVRILLRDTTNRS